MSKIIKFLNDSIRGQAAIDEQVKFLKNFTPDKVRAKDIQIFVKFMLKNMPEKLNMPEAIDICGTGGSGLPRINTSTISAFILAELGVKVAKHGNKAASGRFGSFDLLEKLGVDIGKNSDELKKIFKKTGLAFIFARNFHPVMKYFAEARMKIGKPTIFNILGPLLNPTDVKMQIIGTSFKKQMRLIAEACKLFGKKKIFVVRGRDGLDEVTLTKKTDIVELNNGKIFEYTIKPEDFGIERCKFKEIAGGSAKFNTDIALKILNGKCKSRHKDLIFANTALALKLIGKVDNLKDGFVLAKSVLGVGKLEAYKGNILGEIAASKILKKSYRDFYSAIKRSCINKKTAIIAEIKKASPSAGNIFKGKFDAGKIAKIYEKCGVSAISVVTDEKYFKGSFKYMKQASKATNFVPILCKDFIIHEYQIFKAREFGADAILLIAALLSPIQISKFLKVAESLGMNALIEVHNEEELKKVLKTDAKIIGINNRNLKNFEVDLNTTLRLKKLIPADRLVISESGINSKADIEKLATDGALVGATIIKSNNICQKLYEIT